MARTVHRARKDRGRRGRMVYRVRKASIRDKLFGPRVRLATFGRRDVRWEASLAMLEISRSRPPCFHLAPHRQVRDKNHGERVPFEPSRLRADGLGQVLVHRTVLQVLHRRTVLHTTVLHGEPRSHLHWKVHRNSLGAAVRSPVFLRLAPALPLEAASDRLGFEAALSAEPAPQAWAAESLDEDGESERRPCAEVVLAAQRTAALGCCLEW